MVNSDTEIVSLEPIASDNENKSAFTSILRSSYEDIESALVDLPKVKRRRVRKRKIKNSTPKNLLDDSSPTKIRALVRSCTEQKLHVPKESNCQEKAELPFRNLNLTMKARVVRAVSPSAINQRECDSNGTLSNPDVDGTLAKEPTNLSACVLNQTVTKARVVRALPDENSVTVKREQLEAVSSTADTLQQITPREEAKEIDTIEIESSSLVSFEEGTHETTITTV